MYGSTLFPKRQFIPNLVITKLAHGGPPQVGQMGMEGYPTILQVS